MGVPCKAAAPWLRQNPPVRALLLLLALAAAQVPNRSWDEADRGQLISPDLGDQPMNQPSVVHRQLLLAGNGHFELWDISDPTAPSLTSSFDSPHADGEAESHAVALAKDPDGRVLLATISGVGVDLWDLSDPGLPALLSSVDLEGVFYGDNSEAVWGLAWQGERLYVGGTNTGVHVLDVAIPEQPLLVARIPTAEFGGVSAGPLWAVGNTLIVTTPKNHAGVATLDVGDPDDPTLLDFVAGGPDSYIGAFYGCEARLLTPLRTYDVLTDPASIELLGSAETVEAEYASFADGQLFLGRLRPNPGVDVIDLGDPNAATVVASIDGRRDDVLGGRFTDDQFSMPVGNLVVLADDEIRYGAVLAVHDPAPDTSPQRLLCAQPEDGATGLPLTSRIGLSFSDPVDLDSVDGDTVVVRPVGGEAIRGWFGLNQTLVSFWPSEPLLPDTTYEIVLPAGGVADLVGNGLPDAVVRTFSTGDAVAAPPCSLDPTTPVAAGEATTLTTSGAAPSWDFGDGESGSGAAVEHAWAEPGRYPITLRVTDGDASRTCGGLQVVTPVRAGETARASAIATDGATAWVVNPDAGTLATVDLVAGLLGETDVGPDPRFVARADDGALWVSVRGDDAVVAVRDGRVAERIATGHGTYPAGLVLAGDTAFVALEGTGEVLTLDLGSASIVDRTPLGPDLDGVAVRLRGLARGPGIPWVASRFVSRDGGGQLFFGSESRLLPVDAGPDDHFSGRGVPSYLQSVAVRPDGVVATAGSKANIERGAARDGEPLDPDNTVRAVVIQVSDGADAAGAEQRTDLDDHGLLGEVAYSEAGDVLFVAATGNHRVDALDSASGDVLASAGTGLAPHGLAVHGATLLVQDQLSRTLSVFDVSGLLDGSDPGLRPGVRWDTVADEPLDPEVLLGKQIFWSSASPDMSQDGYLACVSCHLDGDDGRTWDFTDRGEGLRNTIDLRGRAGTAHGPLHWSANFDEVQDFEHDIRGAFGGRGLLDDADFESRSDPLGLGKTGLSPRLDALAAYVSSLDEVPRSPFRDTDGELTKTGRRGLRTLATLDCLECHGGPAMTDSGTERHDVGTTTVDSGQRLGGELDGFDTPTLFGLAHSAPYFHDGSAPNLLAVIDREGHGDAQGLTLRQKEGLISLLLELESDLLPLEDQTGCACSAGGGASMLALLLVVGRRRRR